MTKIEEILSKDTIEKIKESELCKDADEQKYILYIHIISSDISDYDYNKYYVGITCHEDENERWRNGNGYYNQKLFYRAIKKYGWDNIEHLVVSRLLSLDDIEKYEIILISELKSNLPMYGYNIASGGYTGGGFTRKIAQYDLNGFLLNLYPSMVTAYKNIGVTRSQGSYIHYAATHENTMSCGFMWRFFDEEMPPKQIPPYVPYNCKTPVLQYSLEGDFIKEWNSIVSANNYYNVTSIENVCLGKTLTAGGYQWKYKLDDSFPKNIGSAGSKHKKKKHIFVYDIDGNFINDYYGISTAFRDLEINSKTRPNLAPCYKDITRNLSYGYRWTETYYEKLPPLKLPKNNRPVVQIDEITKEIINIFPSTTDAAKTVDVYSTSIRACCDHKKKRIKGYQWEYIENISEDMINDETILEKYKLFLYGR